MHLSHHPLIEAVTQPFADNAEMKLAAAAILEEQFDADHPSIPSAIKQLEVRDKKKGGWIWKSAIWVLALAVLYLTANYDEPAIRTYMGLEDFIFDEPKAPVVSSHLTEQQKLLLGDPDLDELTQKKLLFESDPNNPAYFAEFAGAYFKEHSKIPDNFLETASRIDPDNSFFPCWAAGLYQDKAIDQISTSLRKSSASTPPPRFVDGVKLRSLPVEQEYTILDQIAYDDALHLIERASQLPKFDNYTMSLMTERMRLLPQPQNLIEYVRKVANQYSAGSQGIISLIKVARLLNARAEELSKKGDKETFVTLAKNRDALIEALMKSGSNYLIDALVHQTIASSTATNFHAAADRLDLTDLEEKYRKQNEAFIAESDRRRIADSKSDSSTDWIEQKSGILHIGISMIADQVKTPPPLTDADLKPLRMVDHELAGRVGIITAALGLLFGALLVFLFRFLAARPIRLTAKRFSSLLNASDWLWITGLGVVLPILAFLYISRVSPVSGRDYGISCFLFLFPGIHLAVLLMNLLFIPAVVTRWRLKRRGAAFHLGSHLDWLSLPVIAVMLGYSIAAYPALVKFGLDHLPMKIALAAPAMGWLGFVFLHALRIFLGNARSRIIQTASAIAVLPAYALAVILLCALIPIYHAGERYWIPQDKLILIDPDAPDLGAYECRVATQKRLEMKEMLGLENP